MSVNNRTISRNSNIELLRIITMCGVIILHLNNSNLGKAFVFTKGTLNYYALNFLECMCIGAVDVFIIISGLFMYKKNKITIDKPLRLILQVIIFSAGHYLAAVTIGSKEFSTSILTKSLLPINWFVMIYIALYILSPFINVVINNIDRKTFKTLLVVCFALFSVYATGVDVISEFFGESIKGLSTVGMYGSQWGYSIVNFIFCYLLGAYIAKYDDVKINKSKNIILILACALLLSVWSILNNKIGFITEKSAFEYCNPILIIQSVLIVVLFKSIDIKENKIINKLASGAFVTFLLHNYFISHINIEKICSYNFIVLICAFIIISICIYIVCFLISIVYDFLTKPINLFLNKHTITVTANNKDD